MNDEDTHTVDPSEDRSLGVIAATVAVGWLLAAAVVAGWLASFAVTLIVLSPVLLVAAVRVFRR